MVCGRGDIFEKVGVGKKPGRGKGLVGLGRKVCFTQREKPVPRGRTEAAGLGEPEDRCGGRVEMR